MKKAQSWQAMGAILIFRILHRKERLIMSLKKLSSFLKFDASSFFASKEMMLSKVEVWKEGEDRDHLQTRGTKVTGVIFRDRTDYNGETGVNAGESIVFKVSRPLLDFDNWKPFNTVFRVTDVTKAVVYGDYRNQLSITVPKLTAVSGAGSVKKAGGK